VLTTPSRTKKERFATKYLILIHTCCRLFIYKLHILNHCLDVDIHYQVLRLTSAAAFRGNYTTATEKYSAELGEDDRVRKERRKVFTSNGEEGRELSLGI